MELYRPLSAEEYRKIEEKSFRAFPARNPGQPFFTALLSEVGASDIARRMKIEKQSEQLVYVVSFLVDDTYIRQFPIRQSEKRERSALWIPAEELEILNQHLIGDIRVLASYELNHSGDLFFA